MTLYKGTQKVCPIVTVGTTPTLTTKNITANGTYNASSDNADGYSSVTVNVSGGGGEYDYRNLIGNFYILTDGSITPIRFKDVTMGGSVTFTNIELNTLMTSMGSTGDIYTNTGMDYSARATSYLSNASWAGFPSSIKHISFKAITGEFDIRYGVYSDMTSLKSVDFSNATKLKLQSAFTRCTNLESVDLSSLSDLTLSGALGGSASLGGAFAYTALTTLSFPALKSTAFGSRTNQFNNMLRGVTGCTVHFPSNLQSVIGSWSSVTSGFGGTNTIVLFDLPATT